MNSSLELQTTTIKVRRQTNSSKKSEQLLLIDIIKQESSKT
jgi:hypothetical protein